MCARRFDSRSQAPAWDRISPKLCFVRVPTRIILQTLEAKLASEVRPKDSEASERPLSPSEAELRGQAFPSWSLGTRSRKPSPVPLAREPFSQKEAAGWPGRRLGEGPEGLACHQTESSLRDQSTRIRHLGGLTPTARHWLGTDRKSGRITRLPARAIRFAADPANPPDLLS